MDLYAKALWRTSNLWGNVSAPSVAPMRFLHDWDKRKTRGGGCLQSLPQELHLAIGLRARFLALQAPPSAVSVSHLMRCSLGKIKQIQCHRYRKNYGMSMHNVIWRTCQVVICQRSTRFIGSEPPSHQLGVSGSAVSSPSGSGAGPRKIWILEQLNWQR